MSRDHAFLRLLTVVDGRSRDEIVRIVGCSRATLKRYLADARQFGCRIEYEADSNCYWLMDAGPFDVLALQRVLPFEKEFRGGLTQKATDQYAQNMRNLLSTRWASL